MSVAIETPKVTVIGSPAMSAVGTVNVGTKSVLGGLNTWNATIPGPQSNTTVPATGWTVPSIERFTHGLERKACPGTGIGGVLWLRRAVAAYVTPTEVRATIPRKAKSNICSHSPPQP